MRKEMKVRADKVRAALESQGLKWCGGSRAQYHKWFCRHVRAIEKHILESLMNQPNPPMRIGVPSRFPLTRV